jgi:hypothetical protein
MKKGQKKFIEIGNIFEFAEARLQKKVSRGDMEYYTANDVINNAVKIREYMDKNPKGLKIPTQTKEERRVANLKARKLYLWNKMMSLRG